ncbi:MAG: hypothetical protein AAF830_16330 [Pseudomonadota bacterium]
MSGIEPFNPTIGIETVGRIGAARPTMPAGSQAQVVGSRVREARIALYDDPSSQQTFLQLTEPSIPDPGILQPAVFDGRMVDIHEKLKDLALNDPLARPILELFDKHMTNVSQCRENLSAINRA